MDKIKELERKKRRGDIGYYLISGVAIIGSIVLIYKCISNGVSNTFEMIDMITTMGYALAVIIMSGVFIDHWEAKKDEIDSEIRNERLKQIRDEEKKSHDSKLKE